MRIIAKSTLREFWERYPDAKEPLLHWYNTTKASNWTNFVEVRQIFRKADSVGTCIVFDISGNKYRLITYINFGSQIVYTLHVLTHADYDRESWKKDCGC